VESIREALTHHSEVKKAILYGSRAKGTHHPGSEVDLTLCGEKLDRALLTRIENELDDLLLPHRIDLSLFETLTHPEPIDHIRRVGVTFYERATATR
jgi:predicted nucleotidyltransferase